MKQYLELCQKILQSGIRKPNRTGIDTIGIQGAMMQFDLANGFPAVTTKKLAWHSCFAEMLGFLRGYDNAADFRELDCKVWDANANENKQWLNNLNRKGEDDLGRIYGVQARDWGSTERITDRDLNTVKYGVVGLDQLQLVVDKLNGRKDDRRLIVTHWNPGELHQMSLPPCHMFYQFGIEEDRLNLAMYQRSCDMPLGVPFNIAGYAWLLSVIAQITKLKPGVFTHFLFDTHIYVNQIDGIKTQLHRLPHMLPQLIINPDIKSLNDLETWVTINDFELNGYTYDPAIKFPFAV